MVDDEQIDGLRLAPGKKVRLSRRSTDETFSLPGKRETRAAIDEGTATLGALQYRLWAERRRSVLLVLQGMDASGKDGAVRRVFSGLNPAGVRVTAFSEPEGHELAHDYLWRVHAACPPRGYIGVFNRSHYEDLVTAPLVGAVTKAQADRRVEDVVAFERMLMAEGTTLIKCFFHVSRDEQRKRLRERIVDPDKAWKFAASDVEARARWDEYRARYENVMAATSTPEAPWFVIPADHKWVRDAVLLTLTTRTLERLDPQPPAPSADLARLRELVEVVNVDPNG